MTEDTTPRIESTADAGAGALQYVLGVARQGLLGGGEEPLVERVRAPVEREPEAAPRQVDLFEEPQPELPLHANGECRKGYRVREVVSDGPNAKPLLMLEVCGCKGCKASEAGNTAERARNLWDGTARKGNEKIGLRHVVGEAALGVLVVTVPPEFRGKVAHGGRFKKLEGESVRAVEGWLREVVGLPGDAGFYIRNNSHPCGDERPDKWHPHLNLVIPCWAWLPGEGRAKRFSPYLDLEPLRAALRDVFSRVLGEGAGERVQCHWQYRQEEGEKRHTARYVPRMNGFSQWAKHMPRPAQYGLASPRRRAELEAALDSLHMKPLPAWDSSGACVVVGRGSTEEAARIDAKQQRALHLAICPSCRPLYPECCQTMRPQGWAGGPAPPWQGPPLGALPSKATVHAFPEA